MAKTIHKYVIDITCKQTIQVPDNAVPLCFQLQNGVPCLWCKVDTEQPMKELNLFIAGTGHNIEAHWAYIGTIQKDGFVWHLFF